MQERAHEAWPFGNLHNRQVNTATARQGHRAPRSLDELKRSQLRIVPPPVFTQRLDTCVASVAFAVARRCLRKEGAHELLVVDVCERLPSRVKRTILGKRYHAVDKALRRLGPCLHTPVTVPLELAQLAEPVQMTCTASTHNAGRGRPRTSCSDSALLPCKHTMRASRNALSPLEHTIRVHIHTGVRQARSELQASVSK